MSQSIIVGAWMLLLLFPAPGGGRGSLAEASDRDCAVRGSTSLSHAKTPKSTSQQQAQRRLVDESINCNADGETGDMVCMIDISSSPSSSAINGDLPDIRVAATCPNTSAQPAESFDLRAVAAECTCRASILASSSATGVARPARPESCPCFICGHPASALHVAVDCERQGRTISGTCASLDCNGVCNGSCVNACPREARIDPGCQICPATATTRAPARLPSSTAAPTTVAQKKKEQPSIPRPPIRFTFASTAEFTCNAEELHCSFVTSQFAAEPAISGGQLREEPQRGTSLWTTSSAQGETLTFGECEMTECHVYCSAGCSCLDTGFGGGGPCVVATLAPTTSVRPTGAPSASQQPTRRQTNPPTASPTRSAAPTIASVQVEVGLFAVFVTDESASMSGLASDLTIFLTGKLQKDFATLLRIQVDPLARASLPGRHLDTASASVEYKSVATFAGTAPPLAELVKAQQKALDGLVDNALGTVTVARAESEGPARRGRRKVG